MPSVPTYDYRCRECGRITEVIHSMLEDGPTTCPHCGGQLRRVLHPTGIIFKGSGFYRTDSRAGSASAESSEGAKAAASKGSETAGSGADAGASAEKPKVTGTEGASTPSKE